MVKGFQSLINSSIFGTTILSPGRYSPTYPCRRADPGTGAACIKLAKIRRFSPSKFSDRLVRELRILFSKLSSNCLQKNRRCFDVCEVQITPNILT